MKQLVWQMSNAGRE